ncbi:hypothetical protein XENORESO_012002 [Xenotaenia resolanae]|uniref:Uncharacterized protein n=1 Tax=Xenotaenia resolanae TaxID=208358 RepID=A0ABV0VWC4_9TELE
MFLFFGFVVPSFKAKIPFVSLSRGISGNCSLSIYCVANKQPHIHLTCSHQKGQSALALQQQKGTLCVSIAEHHLPCLAVPSKPFLGSEIHIFTCFGKQWKD